MSRRDFGESGRLALVYTEELGKTWVKFSGVNMPGRKMKAFSETLVWCEYRFHITPGAGYAKATGGNLISSFPNIRKNLEATAEALVYCELLSALTVLNSPSFGKYSLITEALEALDSFGSIPWMPSAFGLRFLELAGYGVREKFPFKEDEDGDGMAPLLWEALYQASWESLKEIPFDPSRAREIKNLVEGRVEEETHRTLRTPLFVEALKKFSVQEEHLVPC